MPEEEKPIFVPYYYFGEEDDKEIRERAKQISEQFKEENKTEETEASSE